MIRRRNDCAALLMAARHRNDHRNPMAVVGDRAYQERRLVEPQLIEIRNRKNAKLKSIFHRPISSNFIYIGFQQK